MSADWKAQYLGTLRLLNLREVSRETGRGYRTLHSYLRGERGVPREAAHELLAFLRSQASTLTRAADAMEAALTKEGRK